MPLKDFSGYLPENLKIWCNNARQEKQEIWKKINFDFSKVIVLSVVNDDEINKELKSFEIPPHKIIYKLNIDLYTLPKLIMEILKPPGHIQ
jgi:hypothetical protein